MNLFSRCVWRNFFSFFHSHKFSSVFLSLLFIHSLHCRFFLSMVVDAHFYSHSHTALNRKENSFISSKECFFPLRVVKYFSPVSMFSNDFRSINENAFEWSVNFFTRYVFWAYVQCTIKDPMKDSWNYVNRLLRRLQ